jgi:DNA-binding MarR family transcriptional regulator
MGTEDAPGRTHLFTEGPRTDEGVAAVTSLQALSSSVHEAEQQALQVLHARSSDALALQHLVMAGETGRFLTPSQLARLLKLSSAAITKLVDRLVGAGRVERRPNPEDRRGVVVVPVGTAHQDVAAAYGPIHGPVVDVINELTDAEAKVVARFAARLAEVIRLQTAMRTVRSSG